LTLKETQICFREQSRGKKSKIKKNVSETKPRDLPKSFLPQITANGNFNNPIIQTTVIDCRIWTARHNNSSRFWTKWISTAGVPLTQALFDQSVFY
jgi:hypothetical protein